MPALNEVYVCGVLERDPDTQATDAGTPVTTARLCVIEERDGRQFKLFVPVEAWGKAAQMLSGLHEGEAVLVRGKLKWHAWEKNGQRQGTLIVSTWSVQPLHAPVGVATGSPTG